MERKSTGKSHKMESTSLQNNTAMQNVLLRRTNATSKNFFDFQIILFYGLFFSALLIS